MLLDAFSGCPESLRYIIIYNKSFLEEENKPPFRGLYMSF
jgi:hypothetical protein